MMDAYLIASDGSKYTIEVLEDGSLNTISYTGSYPFWFNPIDSSGGIWSIKLSDETGTLETVRIA